MASENITKQQNKEKRNLCVHLFSYPSAPDGFVAIIYIQVYVVPT